MKKSLKLTIMFSAAFLMMMAFAAASPMTAKAASAKVQINSKNFPNQNFRKALKSYDEDGDGYLVISEMKSLDLADKGISNLKGIGYFTKLQELVCSDNNIGSLNLRKNTALKEIYCDNNKLTSLNLGKNAGIVTLSASSNQLTSLNLGKNTKLATLVLSGNQFKSIDLTKNTKLTTLDVSGNQLTSLNLTKNKKLKSLDCYGNRLSSLNLTKNTKVKELVCDGNRISNLNLSKCKYLKYLDCAENNLSSLDVRKNTRLTVLNCSDNKLTKLDLTKNKKLNQLNCSSNKLSALDLSRTEFTAENLNDTLFTDSMVAITWSDKSVTIPADREGKTVKVNGVTYMITEAGKTVSYEKPASKDAKTVTIPATIKIHNLKYRVTSVSAEVFKDNKKITNLILGKCIRTIETKAFCRCKNLKRVTFQGSKVKAIEEKAFAKTKKNLIVKAPKDVLETYKEMMTSAGAVVK